MPFDPITHRRVVIAEAIIDGVPQNAVEVVWTKEEWPWGNKVPTASDVLKHLREDKDLKKATTVLDGGGDPTEPIAKLVAIAGRLRTSVAADAVAFKSKRSVRDVETEVPADK